MGQGSDDDDDGRSKDTCPGGAFLWTGKLPMCFPWKQKERNVSRPVAQMAGREANLPRSSRRQGPGSLLGLGVTQGQIREQQGRRSSSPNAVRNVPGNYC